MSAARLVASSSLLIFDLFHTLVSFRSDGTPGASTSELLGIPEPLWNNLLWESSDRRLRNELSDDAATVRELAHLHDSTIPEETILIAAIARANRFRDCLVNPPQHRVDVIRELHSRGHTLVLLSNADSMEKRAWHQSPFASFFMKALFSCDTGHVKPEREVYQIALGGLSPDQAAFIGDGGSDELKGARACGIPTIMTTEIIGVFWPDLVEKRRGDANHVITRLEDLL
jgi:putative hydrolase of the HAD superfamily